MLDASAIELDFHRRGATGLDPVPRSDPANVIKRVLEVPDDRLDYADAKLTFDSLVDPDIDSSVALRELGLLVSSARDLTYGDRRSAVKLGAVRRLLHDPGPWNDHRPFGYDMNDPTGRLIRNKLLHNYLRTRLGQCVSMPILFLIIAERLGLNVALASAPEHLFVRYTDESGRIHNIEATSGAHPARDRWFRENFPITDRSIENGIYMRSLSKREGIAAMASTVIEYLDSRKRFEELIAVCEIILRHHSKDVPAMLWLGSASGRLLDQIRERYPLPGSAPPQVLKWATSLMQRNRDCFATAEQLGWVPFDGRVECT